MEYVMLGPDVNCTEAHARELGALLQGRDVVVNLIPWNPVRFWGVLLVFNASMLGPPNAPAHWSAVTEAGVVVWRAFQWNNQGRSQGKSCNAGCTCHAARCLCSLQPVWRSDAWFPWLAHLS